MKQHTKEPVGKYISRLYRKCGCFISKELSQYGIGSGQMMFLLELYKQDGRSQEELAEILDIDKGTTARAIKKLEEEKFVIRERDEHDKRAYKIYLTDQSKELKGNIQGVLDQWNKILLSNVTEEEIEALVNILGKICTQLNVHEQEGCL